MALPTVMMYKMKMTLAAAIERMIQSASAVLALLLLTYRGFALWLVAAISDTNRKQGEHDVIAEWEHVTLVY